MGHTGVDGGGGRLRPTARVASRTAFPAVVVALAAAALPAVSPDGSAVHGAGSPELPRSELADLWRERDGVYLRVDGRLSREPGVVPRGAREAVVRVAALMRGREWPGRWTLLELEVGGAAGERVRVGWAGTDPAGWTDVLLTGRRAQRVWVSLLDGPASPADLVIRSAGSGLSDRVELGRVWLVDDRVRVWPSAESPETVADTGSAGERWVVERAGGVWRAGRARFPGDWSVAEVSGVRVLLSGGGGEGAAVYASGRVVRVFGDGTSVTEPPTPRWTVRIDEDQGRLVRDSPGDADASGFDAARGAVVVHAGLSREGGVVRRVVFDVEPVEVDRVMRPAVEVRGLAEGAVRVLWEGTLVRSVARLADGTVLIDLPGEVRRRGVSAPSGTGGPLASLTGRVEVVVTDGAR